jgi:hypothetical protein
MMLTIVTAPGPLDIFHRYGHTCVICADGVASIDQASVYRLKMKSDKGGQWRAHLALIVFLGNLNLRRLSSLLINGCMCDQRHRPAL